MFPLFDLNESSEGSSIAVEKCWMRGTMLACVGREHSRLSVTDGCRCRAR